jgi:hypothetical protein
MSERKSVLPCPCGGEAQQIITAVPEVLVRFRPYEFNKAKNVRSNGYHFGRTDEQQHEQYRRVVETQRKLVERRNRDLGKKDGFEFLGVMPGEMADSIDENEGTKETVVRDPVTWLKKTGLYMGKD